MNLRDQNGRGKHKNVPQRQSKGGWESVSERQLRGEGETGESVGEEMKYGEMVTHSSGGKALIYSLCLFWVIYCGCMRVSISTWPLGAEA